MSKAAVAQVLGFIVAVAALIAVARIASMPDAPPAQGEASAIAMQSMPADAPSSSPTATDRASGAPLRYAQLTPTPLPPLFVVRDQQPLGLAGPRPKPLLLHLWASWCGPCVAELPAILAYGRKGAVDVIAVSVDDHFESVQRFFKGAIPPEVAWDEKITLEPALSVESLPTTFLVDTQGRARLRWNGLQDWNAPAMNELIVNELGRTLPAP